MKRRPLAIAFDLACPFCGETSPVEIDEGGGERQEFVDECPVCCHPLLVHIAPDVTGQDLEVWCERS